MRTRTGIGTAVLALLLLAGCTPTPPASSGETEAPEAGPDATPAPTATTPAVREFRMPTACADIVTAETAARFAADGRDLLGGPDGVYGENYFGDPTPEEQAGGITCVWGDEAAPATTVIVSVAPVTTGTRSAIVAKLLDSGLIETELDGALSYARIGDEVSAPGELHVIRNDSWISVVEAVGGEDRFQDATELVDEVTAQVYVSD
jgi:hypothetical protein